MLLPQRGTNFKVSPTFLTVATNLAGPSGTMSYTDTNTAGTLIYYRVGVEE
jgi:hypothetical protein